MAYQVRGRRHMMAGHLQVRATTSSSDAASKTESTTKIAQPTAAIALTTTWEGPTSCTENILTMLPPPGYQIWVNEPVPVANMTVAACYPSEFINSYTSVNASNTASSVVPVMSPFVCPVGYCTMLAKERNYIACCPSGYQFHPPDTMVDSKRPAYGGTCYSDFAVGTQYPVIAYDEEGDTTSKAFSASTSGAQAYAHPIDGFALTSPTIGCPAGSSSSSSGSNTFVVSQQSSAAASNSTTTSTTSDKSISAGAIAGASIGGVIGLAAVVGFIWFILAYYRKNRRPPPPPPKVVHMGDDFAQPKGPIYYQYEAEGGFSGNEIGTSQRLPDEKGGFRNSELNDGHGAFEMSAEAPAELDAGGKDGAGAKGDKKLRLSRLLDNTDKDRVTRMANWKYNQ